jgi:hypothetical protein
LQELNAFRDWTLLNKPTTSEIVLWYALMSINNMTGWKQQFTAANQTVQLMTGLSKATLDRARNKLTQKGLLKYLPGNTRQAGTYELVSISAIKRDQCETNDETNMRPMRDQCETNGETITKHKQNKTKQDNNTPLNPPKEKPQKIAYAEFVFLTEAEHERLIKDYGEADTLRMIEILDNYIGQNPSKNGKKYTDHNRVLRNWVKDRVKEEKEKQVTLFNQRSQNYGKDPNKCETTGERYEIFVSPARLEELKMESG